MIFSHHHAHARRDVDMTQGSTTGHLIRFALPMPTVSVVRGTATDTVDGSARIPTHSFSRFLYRIRSPSQTDF